jgi:hypothetical protein
MLEEDEYLRSMELLLLTISCILLVDNDVEDLLEFMLNKLTLERRDKEELREELAATLFAAGMTRPLNDNTTRNAYGHVYSIS